MNIYLILLTPVLIFLFIKLYEHYKLSQIRNTKTGKSVPSASVFQLFKFALFPNTRPTYFETTIQEGNLGPLYANWFFNQFRVMVNTPELAAKVLLDTKTFRKNLQKIPNPHTKAFLGDQSVGMIDGEDWKRQRSILDPAFYRLELYCDTFAEKTNLMMDIIAKKSFIVNDISEFTQKMTLDVLGKTIFAHEFNSLQGSLQKDLTAYNALMQNLTNLVYNIFYPLTYIPFLPYNKKMKSALNEINNLCYRLVELSKQKKAATSMLDFMVRSTGQEGGLNLKELRDNVVVFFVAGHETTSTSLGFAMHILAQYPDVQEKARKEVDEVLKGKPPTYKDLKELKYLGWVIKEVLRMFPPVSIVPPRRATKTVMLGDYKIPKGTNVGVNISAIHYSKEVYGDPEKFRPERWSPEESKGRHHFAWIPFGGGSRICIGNNFSLLEQRVFLSLMLQKFRWEMVDKNANTEYEKPGIVLAKPQPITLKFTPRS